MSAISSCRRRWRDVQPYLGMRAVRRAITRPSDDRRIVREMGYAMLEYESLRTPTWITLGERDDVSLLGAVTLVELGLEVDPSSETLRLPEAYLLAAG